MSRKTARMQTRMRRKGFMVVHPRWLLTEARATNETPKRWLDWLARQPS